MIANKKGGSRREDFGNLRGIDRRGHVAIDDLKFPSGGLVCDRGYLSLDNFAAVEADPDSGACAVIHIVSVLALVDSDPERSPVHLTST